MILQRLASALRRQDWFQVLIEILIVVIGIFLGLQVQEGYEKQNDQAEQERVVGYLKSDMENNISYINELLDSQISYVESGRELLQILEQEELAPENVEVLEFAIIVVGRRGVSFNAYITSFNDNNLDHILDNDLRRIIDSYIGQSNRDQFIYDHILNQLSPLLPDIRRKSVVSSELNGFRLVKYDFDSLKNDDEYKSSYIAALGLRIDSIRRLREFKLNSEKMLDVLNKHQRGEPISEVTFQ